MSTEALRFEVDSAEVRAMIRAVPRAYNSAFNRGFSSAMGAFTRKFARERLRKGGIQVRRKTSGRGGGSRGVFVPKKMRTFGFKGVLLNRKALPQKAAEVRTRNPVAIAHEKGAVITPRTGEFLAIPIRNVSAARRAGVQIPRGQRPAIIRVRRVTIKARLQFMATFRRFRPQARKFLLQALRRGADNARRQGKKARSRRRTAGILRFRQPIVRRAA